MAKGEISWKRRDDEGGKVQVYAKRTGKRWNFFIREKRFDDWEPHEHPPLEDYLALLDGAERRAARRLIPPVEIERLKEIIRANFPDYDF